MSRFILRLYRPVIAQSQPRYVRLLATDAAAGKKGKTIEEKSAAAKAKDGKVVGGEVKKLIDPQKALNYKLREKDLSFSSLVKLILDTPIQVFNDINCASAFYHVAKGLPRDSKLSWEASKAIEKITSIGLTQKFSSTSLHQLYNGIFKADLISHDKRIEQIVGETAKSLDPKSLTVPHLSALSYCLFRLQVTDNTDVFDRIAANILSDRDLAEFDTGSLVYVLVSLKSLEKTNEKLTPLIHKELLSPDRDLTFLLPPLAGQILLSMHRSGQRNDELIEKVVTGILEHHKGLVSFRTSRTHELAQGCAKLKVNNQDLLEQIFNRLVERPRKLSVSLRSAIDSTMTELGLENRWKKAMEEFDESERKIELERVKAREQYMQRMSENLERSNEELRKKQEKAAAEQAVLDAKGRGGSRRRKAAAPSTKSTTTKAKI